MKKISLYLMVLFYTLAGLNHFIRPEFYSKIMPPWLPWHHELILISGVFELLFAILLIPVRSRRFAAWGIIILLVAVFPANVQMSVNYYNENNPYFWLTIIRLIIQPLLVYWAFGFTKTAKH